MLVANRSLIVYSVNVIKIKNEPSHDKTNKMACLPREDSDQPGNLPIECTAKTLIRLGRCPGLSESLLGSDQLVGFVMRQLKCLDT